MVNKFNKGFKKWPTLKKILNKYSFPFKKDSLDLKINKLIK